MKITDDVKRKQLTMYIPDTRGVTVSRYGRANVKIGMKDGIYTYSRLPGHPDFLPLGLPPGEHLHLGGTCPGATEECQEICYAARPVAEQGPVFGMWRTNSMTDRVPPIPDDCWLLRIHVSGDFNSNDYIANWIERITDRPDVKVWAYTRSWRVPELLAPLEVLRTLPNVQLFASMDNSTEELPPHGWRVAWINGDKRMSADYDAAIDRNHNVYLDRLHLPDEIRFDVHQSFTCPEETGHKANCEECRYCFDGKRNDVTFLKH